MIYITKLLQNALPTVNVNSGRVFHYNFKIIRIPYGKSVNYGKSQNFLLSSPPTAFSMVVTLAYFLSYKEIPMYSKLKGSQFKTHLCVQLDFRTQPLYKDTGDLQVKFSKHND